MGPRLLILGFVSALLLATSAGADLYELEGQVTGPHQRPFRRTYPFVGLRSNEHPFSAGKLVNLGGDFKFKKLRAANYTLTVFIPGWGEARRSVLVGPSFADKKGRIKVKLVLNESQFRGGRRTVSVSQLSVTEKARDFYRKALQHLRNEDVEGATKQLDRAIEESPQFAGAWNQKGTIAYLSGDLTTAEKCFARAHEADPEAYSPAVNLGGVLLARGQPEKALELNLEATRQRPHDPLAHSQLGQNYLVLGRYQEALAEFETTAELDPIHFTLPQLALARAYGIAGDLRSEAVALTDFVEKHPDSPQSARARRRLAVLNQQLADGSQR